MCTAFFDQRSAVHAKIHLLQILTHVFCCTVDISVSLATALYHGTLLWNKPDNPNNFCTMILSKPPPLSPTGAKETTILHLNAKKGGRWPNKDLEKVIHQAIAIPSTIDRMMHNLHNLASASALFFGKTYLLTMGLDSWQLEIYANLIAYESQSANNSAFVASILTAVDT